MPEIESSPADALQRVLGIIVRGRMWILSTAAVVSVATVAALYQMPNRYQSEATLLVVPQQVPARYVTPTTETNISDALQAMTQDVLSRARLLELIDQFGLYAREKQRLAPEEIIELMRSYISIEPADPVPGRKEINSFRISFVAEKAALAQEVTSKLTSFFIQANLKTREDQAANTTNFLQAQLDNAKNNLTIQEAKVQEFKTKYLGELPEQMQGNLASFNAAQLQLQSVQNNLDRAQQQRVYLESLIGGYQRLAARGVPSPGVAAPEKTRPLSSLETAQNDLARLQAQKAQYLIHFKPIYPAVRAIDRAIVATQAVVDNLRASGSPRTETTKPDTAKETASAPAPATKTDAPEDDNAITQLRSQLEANRLDIENNMKSQEQQKAVLAQYQERLNLTPVRELELAGMLRDYELARQDYTDLLGKEQQSQLATSLEKQQGGQQFRLVEPPSLPALPSSPKRLKFSMMGVGGGLFLGLLVAFGLELVRPTFHRVRDVSQKLGAPLVIGLPLLLTPAETRRRRWKGAFQWMAGSVCLVAIGVAEFYVLGHP